MQPLNWRWFPDGIEARDGPVLVAFLLDADSIGQTESAVRTVLGRGDLMGLVVVVDPGIAFRRLWFLKRLLRQLHGYGKKTGVFGLPYCFLQSLLGAVDYSRLKPHFVTEHALDGFDARYALRGSMQLSECRHCIRAEHCDGLGSNPENGSRWAFRLNGRIRTSGKNLFLPHEDARVAQVRERIREHLLHSELEYTNRLVEHVCTFEDGAVSAVSDRFVYYARALCAHEADAEFAFLRNLVLHREVIDRIENLYRDDWVTGHAFSLARRPGGGYRETFYLWPVDGHSDRFLERLGIGCAEGQGDLGGRLCLLREVIPGPYMVGTDWLDGAPKSHKLYYRVADKALLRRLGAGNDFAAFHTDDILLVLRLDERFRVSSYKVEPLFDDRDRALYPQAYSALYDDPRIGIGRLSYDFNLDASARKFSVYYGPNYRNY